MGGRELLMELNPKQPSVLGLKTSSALGLTERELPAFSEAPTFVRLTNKYLELLHSTVELRMTENDQTDPAGRYRLLGSSDHFALEHAATSAWGTTFRFLGFEHSNSRLILDASHGTSWLLRMIATNIGLHIQGNATAASAFVGLGTNPSAPIFAVYGDNTIQFTAATVPAFLGGFTATGQNLLTSTDTSVPIIAVVTRNVASNQVLILRTNRTGAAVNNDEGYETLTTKSDGNVNFEAARLTWGLSDKASASEDGFVRLGVAVNSGAPSLGIELGSSGTALTLGVFGVTPVVRQTSGANLTNNVTAGGVDDTIANFTDLVTYGNDAAAIRNDIYQLARKLKIAHDALRTYGLLT